MASAARGVDASPEGESEPPLHLRILVVDDDPLCLLVVTKQLERCQHQGAPPLAAFRPPARCRVAACGWGVLFVVCACEPGLTRPSALRAAAQ